MTSVDPDGRDAVIILPGIMGSELVEAATGRTLWGLADVGWYVQAWTSGRSLDRLMVTDEERSGHCDRVVARRLLQFPAFAPGLRGFEPYTAIATRARQVAAHPDAVLEFPYDWRLSVEHSAEMLSRAADRHLTRWRAHPAGHPDAKLLLVAHSMGGLVAGYFTEVLGWSSSVRALVTLGTPFYGSVKAAHLLSTGRGAPLPMPRRRLRTLAGSLPGLYDLLPSYRCVDERTSARKLTASDVVAIGGDGELATESFVRRERLLGAGGISGSAVLRPVVGVDQETMQSLILADGVITTHPYTLTPGPGPDGGVGREDRGGDGTVYREAASPPGSDPLHLPQTHGALAARVEGIAHVCAQITAREKGPWLAGVRHLGLAVPDMVAVADSFDIRVTGCDDPAAVVCRVTDAASGRAVAQPLPGRDGDGLRARTRVTRPGLYRVEVKTGGLSAVTDLVLAVPLGDLT